MIKHRCVYVLVIMILSGCSEDNMNDLPGNSVYGYFKTGDIQPGGWLETVIQTEVDGATGHMYEFAPQVSRKPFINKNIAGNKHPRSSWWDGESTGNWIDGFVRLAFLTGEQRIREKAASWIHEIIEVQKKDPEDYIGVYPYEDTITGRWNDVTGELWPQSRAYLAMLAYYEATGDKQVLDAVVRAAGQTIARFQDGHEGLRPDRADHTNTHALMIVEPMIQLYEITGKSKYLDFCEFIYDRLKYHNQLLLDGSLYLHGVHVTENIRIPAMLYQHNNEKALLETSEQGIALITDHYLNAVGAIRSDEMTSYAVPNRGTEYCTITEWFLTTSEMARITGNMHYADLAEKCFMNAAQGARLPDGKGIQYLSYPNQLCTDRHADYKPDHVPLCCNPNAGRLYPYYIGRMWMRSSGGGLTAVFYGPSEIRAVLGKNNVAVSIREKTRYPFEEKIEFVVACEHPVEFPLGMRIPGWCRNFGIMINNREYEAEHTDGMAIINRVWENGDRLLLQLSMQVEMDYRKTDLVSVNRGPLVYSLEVPSDPVDYEEVAPGFPYRKYVMEENALWNVALEPVYNPGKKHQWHASVPFDDVDLKSSFTVEKLEVPDGSLPWEYPHIRITCRARTYNVWTYDPPAGQLSSRQEYLLRQPPLPPSAVYRSLLNQADAHTIPLVPFGTTRLRITCFPYLTK